MYKTRFMIVDLNVNGECRREIIYVGGVMMYLKTTEIYIGHDRYGSWLYNYLCNQCLSPLTL
jgi:hypothetical protein